jgi:hypothetical protein
MREAFAALGRLGALRQAALVQRDAAMHEAGSIALGKGALDLAVGIGARRPDSANAVNVIEFSLEVFSRP